jgi:cbb3-type cytochrome oxidase subunit 3
MVLNTVRILFTLLSLAFFIWVCWRTYSAKNKQELEEAAMLPFQDELSS